MKTKKNCSSISTDSASGFGSGCASVARGPGRPGQSLPSAASGPVNTSKIKKVSFPATKKAKNVNAIMPEHFTWHKKLQRASQHRREITRAHTHTRTHIFSHGNQTQKPYCQTHAVKAQKETLCAQAYGVRGGPILGPPSLDLCGSS